MKTIICSSLIAATALAQAQSVDPYISIKNEITQAVARGNAWLLKQQNEKGYWDDPELPAFTALALNAIVRDSNFKGGQKFPDAVEKGYQWLLEQQKEDGGIYNRGLGCYNTATSVTSLMAAGREDFEPAVVKARAYLIKNQWDIGKPGETDNENDGGIGYGSKDTHTDLSNTYLAIEAIALSKSVVADGKYGEQPELDWEAARKFISRCQNLEETNDLDWASNDPVNKGGFIYTSGQSKAEDYVTKEGRVALRSYGSMSYAGLLSLIYAQVSADDPRVIAVKEWLGHNYTLEENPGLGMQGLFYYFQAMSKALTAANINKLKLDNGKEVDWRRDLATKMLTIQRENGSWVNENGRFMESNPVLVTTFSVLTLQQILDSFPEN